MERNCLSVSSGGHASSEVLRHAHVSAGKARAKAVFSSLRDLPVLRAEVEPEPRNGGSVKLHASARISTT